MSLMEAHTTANGNGAGENIDENDVDIKSMQFLRKTFIAKLTEGGVLPSDPDDRAAVLTLMKDVTSSAIASKRIKADEKAAMSNASVVSNLTEAVRIMAAQKQASRRASRSAQQQVEVVPVKLVPGHTDVGVLPINTAAIIAGSIDTTPQS